MLNVNNTQTNDIEYMLILELYQYFLFKSQKTMHSKQFMRMGEGEGLKHDFVTCLPFCHQTFKMLALLKARELFIRKPSMQQMKNQLTSKTDAACKLVLKYSKDELKQYLSLYYYQDTGPEIALHELGL